MTYKEKLMSEHPEWDESEVEKYVEGNCPYFYLDIYHDCYYDTDGIADCDRCWGQEIPENSHSVHPESEFSCDSCIHKAVCKYRDTFAKALDIIKDIPEWAEVIIRCKYNL